MLEQNEKIVLPGIEAMDALKEIEFILISLRKMGNFYAEKPGELEEYQKETTDFIDNYSITKRLAKVRTIISRHFDDSLGQDDMDDIERHLSDLKFWEPNQPVKNIEKTKNPSISRGKIEQITCKRNELLIVFTNETDQPLLITFHNTTAFKGSLAIGTETCGISEETDFSSSRNIKDTPAMQNEKIYYFKASNNEDIILSVIADHYSTESI
ncbi:hypothetical protein [Pseudomonas palleroniana]